MNIKETKFSGVFIFEPRVFEDDRGYFFETYKAREHRKMCAVPDFVQDNLSFSKQHVLRGLHYQLKHPQGKLVTVIKGRVFDVLVDIRQDSSTFGQWLGVELSDENHRQLYIPHGFAHGFYVLSDEAYFSYKCTDYYTPNDEFGIAWNDPGLAIEWPLLGTPQLSAKDEEYPCLAAAARENLPTLTTTLNASIRTDELSLPS